MEVVDKVDNVKKPLDPNYPCSSVSHCRAEKVAGSVPTSVFYYKITSTLNGGRLSTLGYQSLSSRRVMPRIYNNADDVLFIPSHCLVEPSASSQDAVVLVSLGPFRFFPLQDTTWSYIYMKSCEKRARES